MTETTKKINKEGEEVEFWCQTFDFPETSSFNIIFNNGHDGVENIQTDNITGIQSDRFFTFDETNPSRLTNWADITDEFGVEIPDVEIQALSFISDLNEWNSMSDLFQEVEKDKVYTYTLDLTNVELEEEYFSFKLMGNHSAYLGFSNFTFDDPNKWLEEDLGTGNNNIGLILEETDVRCFLFTATFAGGNNIYEGWTLKIEEGTPGEGGTKGDVNNDGTVDVADISAIISVMAGSASYPSADVNGDKSVDVADISNVISIMAGGN